MDILGLTLFGKHPAWSDHMFVTSGPDSSHLLKRIFYNHSIIPALQQGGENGAAISPCMSFLVFLDSQVYCIVSVPSSDAVGRTRFPLMVACALPLGICLEGACAELASFRQELRELLHAVLVFPEGDDDADRWQAGVARQVESFRSAVDWTSVSSGSEGCEISLPVMGSLMTRLIDEHDVLNLQSCSYAEACVLAQAGLKQFKVPVPVMLLLDQADHGDALLFALDRDAGFRMQRYLQGNLPSLSVAEANLPTRVIRLLDSSSGRSELRWGLGDVPSLKLDAQSGGWPTFNLSGKHLCIVVAALFLLSVLVGLLFGGEGDHGTTSMPSEVDMVASFSARDAWIRNSTAYVDWVRQFTRYVDAHPSSIPSQGEVMRALRLELNPFSIVKREEFSLDFVENPNNRSRIDQLDQVYVNIDQLREALIVYYEQYFTDELSISLIKEGYDLPSFIAADLFSEVIQPDFGIGFIGQFDACTKEYQALESLLEASMALEHTTIQPLGQLFPGHAEFVREYLQMIIAESGSLDAFQRRYSELSQVLLYPDLIQPEALDVEALSTNVEWQGILLQEASLQSIRRLVGLLGAYQLIGAGQESL